MSVDKIKTYIFGGSIISRVRRLFVFVSRRLYRVSVITSKTLARATSKVARKAHHYGAHKPHSYLLVRSPRYARWHSWQWHPHIHYSALGVYLLLVGILVFNAVSFVFAADQTDVWDFSTPSEFSIDAGIETTNGVARLKAQNYTSDANTVALYHLDESSGTNADDNSTNNNDATIQNSPSWGTGNLNNSISLNGNNQFLSANDSPSLSLTGQHSLEAWTKFNSNFGTSSSQDQGIFDKGNYRLYYDRSSGRINYEIANNNASGLTRVAGNDTSNSWSVDGQSIIRAQIGSGSTVYAGLGLGTGDAEVWRWNGSAWTKIGGDGVNGSWADQTFEDVNALEMIGTVLYAGLGTNASGDGEVWSCDTATNCSAWTKIGGDGLSNGWAINLIEAVLSMDAIGSNLYVGTGLNAAEGDVWRWNGTTWTQVGGDALNSSWAAATYEGVYALTNDGTNLYAGLGNTANADGEVWRYNGTTWTKIGGDGVNSSFNAEHEQVNTLDYFGGNLYVGLGTAAGDGDVWRWNGSAWTKIGGDGLNSGWAASTYEGVFSLTNDGTNLYAGLGNSAGDGEVWRWNGSAWTKIGGDGLNSGFSATQGFGVYALTWTNNTLFAGLYSTSFDGTMWSWNGTAWTRIGGGLTNKSWGYRNLQSVESSTTYDGKLYVGTGLSIAGMATVWEYDGSNWQPIGGQGISSSWAPDTYENVFALQSYNGKLYAALGTTATEAEVWEYNGTTWTKIGGDGVNSSWNTSYESVHSLAVYNGALVAGIGSSAQDGEVWSYNGTTWTKIGGDGVNSSWAAAVNIEAVQSLVVYNNALYAGLGNTGGDGDVWRYNGSSWLQVGGDGLNSGWAVNTMEEVFTMRVYNGKLVAGTGSGTDDAEVWQFDGTTWTKIGGDDVNSSWTNGTYERVRALGIYNGELYSGIGDGTGEGELWKYNGSTWTQVAGDSIGGGFTNVTETVNSILDYRGKLFIGTGFTQNADAAVWSLGGNAFLQSNQVGQDTSWHHIAATYNGSVMKLFIDGTEDASTTASVSVGDGALPLLIGSTYGSGGRGENQGFFQGSLDELRISNTARSSFTTKPYLSTPQTVSLANASRTNGVLAWDTYSASEQTNGGTVTYRLSDDGGTTWKYWDGSSWVTSSSTTQANSAAVINANIDTFPVTFNGIKWQAVLVGNGDQQVSLSSVSLGLNVDTTQPNSNASSLTAYKANGGSAISSNAWTNGGSPYFSWTAGNDVGSGIKGYCLYLGSDANANPITTKGILGNSPVATGGNCQFIVSGTNLDLATSGFLSSPLATSNSAYYLNVRAIDNSGNVFGSSAQFQFRFDNTPPTNPGFISAPSGFINSKSATLTWPTSGGQSPADSNSGIGGLQYRINNTSWYGDSHSGSGDISDLLSNDGNYVTVDPPDFDNLDEGVNTVYFRTWDQAGNVTSNTVSAALKINTNGAPTEPLNLTANPPSNTTNSFSFNWDSPDVFVGDEGNLSYCYTVNAVPSPSNCNFTSGGVTSLGAGPYATQPGANTLYVVARDESSNINYSNYSSVNFSANTPSPGMPTNVDIVDVSIKTTSNWRLALTWEPPTNAGAGIASYKVYRSSNNTTFSFVGSSSSTTYIDAGLAQQTYYYKVKACDSTNNCGADSAVVSLLPTGKFTSPATLTFEPTISNITTKKARITWATDRASDSKVSIGTSSGQYSPSEVGNSDQVTQHTIDLDNLAAGTTYYFVVKWTDEDGNTGNSQEYTFTTSPAPIMKEISTLSTTLSSAIVGFTSEQATKVNIYFGASESFGGVKSINTSVTESTYNFGLDGLSDGTKYFYKLSAFDSEGNEYPGNIFSFTTPPRPKISNLQFQPVDGEPTSTQKVTWDTNVPASSTITYGKNNSAGVEIQDSELKTQHVMVLKGLEDNSEYFLLASGRDKDGNLSISDKQVFKTALDTRAPKIKDIAIEVSIKGTGAEARGQVVVSWVTDEPSGSQVAFAEGSGATVFNNKTAEDSKLTTEHVVIISDLQTNKLYSVRPLSKDKSGNEGMGNVQDAIVGKASDSILTIILTTLQGIFGF